MPADVLVDAGLLCNRLDVPLHEIVRPIRLLAFLCRTCEDPTRLAHRSRAGIRPKEAQGRQNQGRGFQQAEANSGESNSKERDDKEESSLDSSILAPDSSGAASCSDTPRNRAGRHPFGFSRTLLPPGCRPPLAGCAAEGVPPSALSPLLPAAINGENPAYRSNPALHQAPRALWPIGATLESKLPTTSQCGPTDSGLC